MNEEYFSENTVFPINHGGHIEYPPLQQMTVSEMWIIWLEIAGLLEELRHDKDDIKTK
jgi:hypothetical protein